MSHYTGRARTSYFKTKDEELFLKWVAGTTVDYVGRNKKDQDELVLFCYDDSSFHILPGPGVDESDFDINDAQDRFLTEFKDHIHPDYRVVIMGSGWEGDNFVIGEARIIGPGCDEFMCLGNWLHKQVRKFGDGHGYKIRSWTY